MDSSDPDRAAAPDVDLVDATGAFPKADAAWLHEHARKAMAALGATGSVSIKVVSDAEMAAAHVQWLEVEGTTDVLTFDIGSDPAARVIEADILLCLDEGTRQANSRGHTPRQELLLYTLHGLLHCLGHDDHNDQAFTLMHAEEDRVLNALGVGATFARPDRSASQGGGT